MRERWGVVGQVRAVEVTAGGGGWHPHLHAIVVLERQVSDVELVELWAPLIGRWQHAVEAAGGRRPDSLVALDVRRVDDARQVSDYVTDAGSWSVGAEMTAGPIKLGRCGGRWSMFSLLGAAAVWGDAEAAGLWAEYEQATKGRRAIVRSRGLYERYGIGETDDEDAAEGDEADDVIAEVEVPIVEWVLLAEFDATDTYVEQVEAWAVAGAHGPPPEARQLVLDVLAERQRRRLAA